MKLNKIIISIEPNKDTPRVSKASYAAGLPASRFCLVQTDCIKGTALLPDESVDLTVASPPYNLDVAYQNYRDKLPHEDYLNWTCAWTQQVRRVLKSTGSFFLNLGAGAKDPTLPFEVVIAITHSGFVLQNVFHWVKAISILQSDGTRVTAGPFKPMNSIRHVNNCHEYVFHFTQRGDVPLDRTAIGVPYKDKSCIARFPGSHGRDVRCRGNTWFLPYTANYNRGSLHPAKFPVELPEFCMRLHGRTRELFVLDPFVGTGASALAAKRCEVKQFIGFDLCRDYLQQARQRLAGQAVTVEGLDTWPSSTLWRPSIHFRQSRGSHTKTVKRLNGGCLRRSISPHAGN